MNNDTAYRLMDSEKGTLDLEQITLACHNDATLLIGMKLRLPQGGMHSSSGVIYLYTNMASEFEV